MQAHVDRLAGVLSSMYMDVLRAKNVFSIDFVCSNYDDDQDVCNSPCSYRQPSGNGQSLSRRYCRHSGWLFSCATRMAQEFQGALAVSRKYFKQSKWPYSAASQHAHVSY